jgi:hypothetical protein
MLDVMHYLQSIKNQFSFWIILSLLKVMSDKKLIDRIKESLSNTYANSCSDIA